MITREKGTLEEFLEGLECLLQEDRQRKIEVQSEYDKKLKEVQSEHNKKLIEIQQNIDMNVKTSNELKELIEFRKRFPK